MDEAGRQVVVVLLREFPSSSYCNNGKKPDTLPIEIMGYARIEMTRPWLTF